MKPKKQTLTLTISETARDRLWRHTPLKDIMDKAIGCIFPGVLQNANELNRERHRFIRIAVAAVAEEVVRQGQMSMPLRVYFRNPFLNGRN